MSSTPAVDASLTGHYEELRAWVLGQPQPAMRPAGLALVARQGVPAWINARSTWLSSSSDTAPAVVPSAGEPAVPDRALTAILASMIEHCQQEDGP
jgi:hypothetical protein